MKAAPKTIFIGGLIAIGFFGSAWGYNYFSIGNPVSAALARDARNPAGFLSVHYKYWVYPGVVVVDLKGTSSVSCVDVFRMLLTTAQVLREKKFEQVDLLRNGKPRFRLTGDYFQKTGNEYGHQNVIYQLNTLPQNVLNLDGTSAFGTWTGGWLGVLTKQTEDLRSFCDGWLKTN